MSKLKISLIHAPLVSIVMSDDLFDMSNEWITEVFGIKAIQGMSRGKGIVYFDIEADEDELELMKLFLKKIYDNHIVKEIDIDLNMN